MARIYILVIFAMFLISCNYKSHSKFSETTMSEKEILLDSIYKLKLVTKSDTSNNSNITQTMFFFDNNKQIKQVSPNILSFLSKKSLIQQVARINLNNRSYYLFYAFTANGEPEFYIIFSPTGNLIAYYECRRDTCQTKIIAKNIDSIAINDFFRNDEKNIEFINIDY